MTHLPYETAHGLGWGLYTSLPLLPDGWNWIQERNTWLLARDPVGTLWFAKFPADGTIFLIQRRTAGVWKWLTTAGRIPVGAHYADYRFTLHLPRKTNPVCDTI